MKGPYLRGRRIAPRAVFWLALAFYSSLAATWALATPLTAAPDEASHIVKAAAVVRGQPIGSEFAPGKHEVLLPPLYAALPTYTECFAFDPEISASCATLPDDLAGEPVPAVTTAGRYNPVYYALVGLPSLLPASVPVLYTMRLVAAVLGAVTLALGLRSVAETRAPAWSVAGLGVAVTPMVMFLLGTVNPSTVEITAGIGLWATLLAAVRDPREHLVRRRMLRAGFLVALLVSAKSLSPLFLALIVLTVVALVPWRSTRALLTDRRAWPGFAIGTVAAVAALGWTRVAGAVARPEESLFPGLTPDRALQQVLERADQYVANMIGVFGMLDAWMPMWSYVLAGTVVLVPVLLVLAVGSRRDRLVIGAFACVCAALPMLLQVAQAQGLGLPWQGRYGLPVVAGLPIMAGFILVEHRREMSRLLTGRLVSTLLAVWGVLQLLGFVTNLRRNTVGASWPFFSRSTDVWHPPLPEVVLILLCALVCLAGVLLLCRLAEPADVERRVDARADLDSLLSADVADPSTTARAVAPSTAMRDG